MAKVWLSLRRLSPVVLSQIVLVSFLSLAPGVTQEVESEPEATEAPAEPPVLSEIRPTDTVFQELQALDQKLSCLPPELMTTLQAQGFLTRSEFALGISVCLDRVNELIASANTNTVTIDDLRTLERLQNAFALEIANFRGRVDALEAKVSELDANQFPTSTTLLGGELRRNEAAPVRTAPTSTLQAQPPANAPAPYYTPQIVAPPLGDIAPLPYPSSQIVESGESGVIRFGYTAAEQPAMPTQPSASYPLAGVAQPIDGASTYSGVPGDREESGLTLDERFNTQGFNREEYNPIFENAFLAVRDNPLSTFSIDVDAASYSNVRRFLNSNQLPPRDAVRIEEFINYFTYDYPNPRGDRPFSITTEVAPAPWNSNHQLVHIGLQGEPIETKDLPPSNLVFLIDVSGSMDSPDKLPLLKSAFRLLTNELDDKDTVSIVVYAGSAGVVLPPTHGNEKEKILDAIDNLQAGGSTAGGEGIERAYQLAKEQFLRSGNNRVILATDGDFNVGVSSEAELVQLIEEKREQDIFLTVLGFGTGNIQDAKMEQIADRGNGNYAYIDNLREAQKVLVNELGATLFTIAKDVKIQVEFNPAKVQAYRLIGYENRLLQNQDFNDDTKDAGELGAGHAVTALYEIIPVGADLDVDLPTVDPLRYQQVAGDPESRHGDELLQVKLRYKEPTGDRSQLITQSLADRGRDLDDASDNFRFAAAVAAFGMILRDSEYKGDATPDEVIELAQESLDDDPGGYRAEFIRLVENYQLLKVAQGDR
jgi:Ca-activated chloride channel family protein